MSKLPCVNLDPSKCTTNGAFTDADGVKREPIPEGLKDQTLGVEDILQHILNSENEDPKRRNREICDIVMRYCSLARCKEETLRLIIEKLGLPDIPVQLMDGTDWEESKDASMHLRRYIVAWCGILRDPRDALSILYQYEVTRYNPVESANCILEYAVQNRIPLNKLKWKALFEETIDSEHYQMLQFFFDNFTADNMPHINVWSRRITSQCRKILTNLHAALQTGDHFTVWAQYDLRFFINYLQTYTALFTTYTDKLTREQTMPYISVVTSIAGYFGSTELFDWVEWWTNHMRLDMLRICQRALFSFESSPQLGVYEDDDITPVKIPPNSDNMIRTMQWIMNHRPPEALRWIIAWEEMLDYPTLDRAMVWMIDNLPYIRPWLQSRTREIYIPSRYNNSPNQLAQAMPYLAAKLQEHNLFLWRLP